MTDEQRQESMRRLDEGMRAMSNEEMAIRQLEAADLARQRGPLTDDGQEAMSNFWGASADAQNNINPDAPMPTLFEIFRRWMRA